MSSLSIPAMITALRARVGALSARAMREDGISTSAIADASDALNAAMTHWKNGDGEDAAEAVQLAAEQLDSAEAP